MILICQETLFCNFWDPLLLVFEFFILQYTWANGGPTLEGGANLSFVARCSAAWFARLPAPPCTLLVAINWNPKTPRQNNPAPRRRQLCTRAEKPLKCAQEPTNPATRSSDTKGGDSRQVWSKPTILRHVIIFRLPPQLVWSRTRNVAVPNFCDGWCFQLHRSQSHSWNCGRSCRRQSTAWQSIAGYCPGLDFCYYSLGYHALVGRHFGEMLNGPAHLL